MSTDKITNSIDCTYLGFFIVVLIIFYYFMWKKNNYENNYENKPCYVVVQTDSGETMMDTNVFIMYMYKVKFNIMKLGEHLPTKADADSGDVGEQLPGEVDTNLGMIRDNTGTFIKLNTKDLGDIYNLNRYKDVVDRHTLDEREELRKRISGKTITEDSDEIGPDELRHALLGLLVDIDIIIFLAKRSSCKKGKINVVAINKFMRDLHRFNCLNGKCDYVDTVEILNTITDAEYDIPYHKNMYINQNTDMSQDIDDKTTTSWMKFKKQPEQRLKLHDVKSHSVDEGFADANTPRYTNRINGKYKKNILRNERIFSIPKNNMVDDGSRSSLMDSSR